MKRIIIIAGAALMAFACSKDENLEQPPSSDNKKTGGPNYEVYDYPSNYEDVLDGYLATIEEGQALADQSIKEAVSYGRWRPE